MQVRLESGEVIEADEVTVDIITVTVPGGKDRKYPGRSRAWRDGVMVAEFGTAAYPETSAMHFPRCSDPLPRAMEIVAQS